MTLSLLLLLPDIYTLSTTTTTTTPSALSLHYTLHPATHAPRIPTLPLTPTLHSINQVMASSSNASNDERVLMIARIQEQLVLENKIKTGAENMLQVYETSRKGDPASKQQIMMQLEKSSNRITELTKQLEYYKSDEPLRKSIPRSQSSSNNDPDLSARSSMMRRSMSSEVLAPNRKFQTDSLDRRKSMRSEGDLLSSYSTNLSEVILQLQIKSDHPSVRLDILQKYIKFMDRHEKFEGGSHTESQIVSLMDYLSDPIKEIRATALRAFRYLSRNITAVQLMIRYHIDYFLVRTLIRDQKYELEREQSLKLIRRWISIPNAAEIIPASIIRVLVSIAEYPDDKLRMICVETLCELSLYNIRVVSHCGGTRSVCQALIESPPELTEFVALTILYLVDKEAMRMYIRPGVELEMIISTFTDAYSRGPAFEERLVACSRAVLYLLKHWTGVIYLCLDDKRAIKSIVDALRLPFEEIRKCLLDLFFQIFRIELPSWFPAFVSARTHSAQKPPVPDDFIPLALPTAASLSSCSALKPLPYIDRLNLLDHYTAMLLLIFVEGGLLEALIDLIGTSEKSVATRATILVGEIIDLCNRLLPASVGLKVQSLPGLFKLASSFKDDTARHAAINALSHIDNLPRTKERLFSPTLKSTTSSSSSATFPFMKSSNTIQRQVEQVKLKLGYQIDDVGFKSLLADSGVLNVNDFIKWNWDTILEIIQGPLMNPRRLEEAVKTTKWCKRVLSFYRPSKKNFCNLGITKEHLRYIKIGSALLKTLISSPDGVRFLSEHPFLNEMAQYLAQIDPDGSTSDPFFSRERMEKTLTGGYFTILGTLTKSKEGIHLLEGFKLFSLYYYLTELRSRDDIIKTIIRTMDFKMYLSSSSFPRHLTSVFDFSSLTGVCREGHSRTLLCKVMTSGTKPIRLFATSYLRQLLRMQYDDFAEWGVPLLITQLYDPSIEIAQVAVSVLDEACNIPENLKTLVKLKPSLDHLGEIGNPLLLRFLSTSTGFKYLNDMGYVEEEMKMWFENGNIHYVLRLELSMTKALNKKRINANPFERSKFEEADDSEDCHGYDGMTQPHFYGELTKTEEGCTLLRQKGHFKEFVKFIRNYGLQKLNEKMCLKLKSVLWAVGTIGATKMGLPFLEETNIIKDIVNIAENAEVLSIKGFVTSPFPCVLLSRFNNLLKIFWCRTCLHVLGLISKSQGGSEILEELGWESVLTAEGLSEGLCVPLDSQKFLQIPKWVFRGSFPQETMYAPPLSEARGDDATEREILKAIGNVSNHILANASLKTLSKIKSEHPEYFNRLPLYIETCRLLNNYHYRLSARRFIQDLFDKIDLSDYKYLEATITAVHAKHKHRLEKREEKEKREKSKRISMEKLEKIRMDQESEQVLTGRSFRKSLAMSMDFSGDGSNTNIGVLPEEESDDVQAGRTDGDKKGKVMLAPKVVMRGFMP
ncbi:Rapamycin-insensitive companion of mTOR, N-term-domain-containing protein [Paraphysoderma sedebokerense]|nr:Rapamycin-insensitive companion of mTOR, N-term-domain-containing protein [Paraphysoderma sedebokerense]